MKKKWIIITAAVILLALILGLRQASLRAARSTLQSETVRKHVEPLFPDGHFMVSDPKTADPIPGPIVTGDPFLSIEPNTRDLCWTFTLATWHDAVTIYISPFGNLVSIGRIKWIGETEQENGE